MNVEIIIARCTRNGVTAWQAVAVQLGRSVDSVRAQHDPGYMRAHIWAPSREAQPEMELVDENDMRSPYAKGPGVRIEILHALQCGPRCVEALAARINRPGNSIRARLADMRADGLVDCDSDGRRSGQLELTWSLTAKGLRVAVTGCDARAKERV